MLFCAEGRLIIMQSDFEDVSETQCPFFFFFGIFFFLYEVFV